MTQTREKNRKGIVLTGSMPGQINIASYDLVIYLVGNATYFAEYVKMYLAWMKAMAGNSDKLISILFNNGMKKIEEFYELLPLSSFREFMIEVSKKCYPINRILEEYISLGRALSILAERDKETIIVGDVKDEPFSVVRPYFQEKYQKNMDLKRTSKAIFVTGVREIPMTGRSGVQILVINGNALGRCQERRTVKPGTLTFVSKINFDFNVPSWLGCCFGLDDIFEGVNVVRYPTEFDF